MPKATGAAIVEAMVAASPFRALAVTRLIEGGSSRGVTELRGIEYAFCSTSTPNAAGNKVTGSPETAPDIAQHSRPRSSIGPMNGASSANGAMVRTRYRTTWLRASCREVLKNTVPASATATNASPALPAAVSSIRDDRPVSLAPEEPPSRCPARPSRRFAEAPARAADRAARVVARPASETPICKLLSVPGAETTIGGGNFADSWLRYPG